MNVNKPKILNLEKKTIEKSSKNNHHKENQHSSELKNKIKISSNFFFIFRIVFLQRNGLKNVYIFLINRTA